MHENHALSTPICVSVKFFLFYNKTNILILLLTNLLKYPCILQVLSRISASLATKVRVTTQEKSSLLDGCILSESKSSLLASNFTVLVEKSESSVFQERKMKKEKIPPYGCEPLKQTLSNK